MPKTPNYTPEGRRKASESARAIIARIPPEELQARLQRGQRARRERVARALELLDLYEKGLLVAK